jgi:uncharacterized BrkB/YihY/UPF0761 family membrane protein
MTDSLLIVTVQLLFLATFLYLAKLWMRKKNNIYPIIFYWVFGVFFVFLMASNVFSWALRSIPYEEESMGSLSTGIALILYIYIGAQYFKKQRV